MRSQRLVLALITAFALQQTPGWAQGFTTDFRLESCKWSSTGAQNPYFSLQPGYQLVLEGEEDGTEIRAEVTVLREQKAITFRTGRGGPITVSARVVEEREFEDGEVVEVSRNWFARCVQTSDIFYFGEEVDLYENGVLVGHEGAWQAGEDGALPGIIMPGSFLLGARYYQEIAPDVAEDRAENIDMGLRVTVPAGTFRGCVSVRETSPLSPGGGGDVKVYCPGVGIVKDGDLELAEAGTADPR
ncbi:MAG TPA: hypothetical protein VMW27_07450 [Thermoanaerobaculia bacterium]|nr:hypothetical protein [Thermoanaerobaculia bacterium]